ncbi:Bcr/CflA family drug resistance efflux transporter [Sphingobium jiangsuense]|uniref:Bcr/CflA family efflux transporter n=1 Tax=Sphingobium jiangsuense TaxID=870476 RepID=A0A7W6BJG2_9SPHN|nr:multidrug effflux MFS transporter [Sphingobium jiangsuense]MBB3927064.1 DHA1 family bicyclomycin/chloramphenicol resistance-like MFS transporter [Sphingobium jiangsuense]GLT00270.1 Bcr/CflA family drug resistance efflux transporter [Sphingobium jiangsuense]
MLTRTQVLLLAGFGALAPLSIDMYLPAIPQLAGELGITAQQAGQSVSIFFAGLAAGQLIAGPLSDRLGRKPLIIGGLLLYLAGSVAACLAPDFAMLMAARLLQALGACSVTVAGRAVVRDKLDHRESARLFSLLALIGGVAPILAPSLGNLVISFGAWRSIFGAMAAGGVLLLAGAAFRLAETRSAATAAQARGEHPFRSYRQLLGNRLFLGNLLAASCNSACMFAYIATSPAVLMEDYGVSRTHFGLLFALNAIGLVAANQLNRILLKSRSPDRMLRGSARNAILLAIAFTLFALTRAGGLWTLLLLLFLVISSVAVVQANTLAGALAVDATRSGAASALFGGATFAAGTLASWIASSLGWGGGAGLAITIAACLVGCAAAILLWAAKGGHQAG